VVDARGAAELHDLVGSPTKARTALGLEPTIGLLELMALLVDCELEALSEPAEAQSASSA
jgi:GDP-D-mannose dehydratase